MKHRPLSAWLLIAAVPLLWLSLHGCGGDDGGSASTCLRLVGELPDLTAYDAKPFGDACLVAAGSRLFLVDPVDGVPIVLDELALAGHCERIAVEDSSAVAAAGGGGVFLVYLTPARGLAQLGHISGIAQAVDADLQGDLVAVADEDAGVWLVDVADPAQPQVLSQVQITGGMWDESYSAVEIEGDRLFILSCLSGLSVYDIADPVAPVPLGSINIYCVSDFVVEDGWAYLEDDENGRYVVRALDLRDPAAPARAGFALTSPYSVDHLCVAGDRLFMTGDAWIDDEEQSRLFVFDIATPAAPRRLATLDIPGQPKGLGAAGERVHVACFLDGLGFYATTCE